MSARKTPKKNRSGSAKSKARRLARPGSLLAEKGGNAIRMNIQGTPFNVGIINGSSTIGLTTQDSAINLAAIASIMFLDPFSVGGRFQLFATLFQQYRICKARIRYVPLLDRAVALYPSLTNTSINICFGWLEDPTNAPSNYNSAVIFGGATTAITQSASAAIGPSGWKWSSTAGSSPTIIDLRQSSFGSMYVIADVAASAANVTENLGRFVLDFDVEFRGNSTVGAIGLEAKGELMRYYSQSIEESKRIVCSSGSASSQSPPPAPDPVHVRPDGVRGGLNVPQLDRDMLRDGYEIIPRTTALVNDKIATAGLVAQCASADYVTSVSGKLSTLNIDESKKPDCVGSDQPGGSGKVGDIRRPEMSAASTAASKEFESFLVKWGLVSPPLVVPKGE